MHAYDPTGPIKELEAQLAAMTQERDALNEKVLRVVRGDFTQICSYCGWEAPPEGAQWEELQAHIKVCPTHPAAQLAASQAYSAQLRDALEICKKEMQGDKWDSLYIDGILALPQDDTALREWGAKLLDEWVEYCWHEFGEQLSVDYLRRKADELRRVSK